MEWEWFEAPPGLGLLRVYRVAVNQVDVLGSHRLSCLINQFGLPFDQLSVFRQNSLHFL
jgi:hypothetical protein